MDDRWLMVPVANVATPVLGGTPSRNVPDYWNGSIHWATAKDVANAHGRYLYHTEELISQQGLNKSAAKVLSKGTVVITARGTVGALVQLGADMSFNQTCYGLVAKQNIIPEYLYYALRSGLSEMHSLTYGTIFETITMKTFEHWKIHLPPLPEQKAIASILGALDDKIELNRKMNETLEAMARAIFKSWFVDFDPIPGHGSHKEWQDSPLGKIPKGWRVAKLGDVAENIRSGADPVHIAPDTPYIGLEHMPKRNIALAEWGKAENVVSNKFLFKKGDILFGKLRPYFHKVGVTAIDGCCSTDILVISSKKASWFGLSLLYLSSANFISYADSTSSGTKMPRTNWSDMARYKIMFPREQIVEQFNTIVTPMVQTIQANIHQARTLSAIRDALLPKLLSGKIRVKDAERFMGRNR